MPVDTRSFKKLLEKGSEDSRGESLVAQPMMEGSKQVRKHQSLFLRQVDPTQAFLVYSVNPSGQVCRSTQKD